MFLNPFAPGAGTPPPELAGRSDVLKLAETAFLRAKHGYPSRPIMLLGLRGVGKTVLLTEIAKRARAQGLSVAQIEANENRTLVETLGPEMRRVLRSLSAKESAKFWAQKGLGALKNFAAGRLSIHWGDAELSLEPLPGIADSGDLEFDLPDMFQMIGRAAAEEKTAWLLLLDEVQYLKEDELSALIVAMHKVAQEGLPVVFIGAGLPQVARLAGDAKSYAERMFVYPEITALDFEAVREAVLNPLKDQGVDFEDEAVRSIALETRGYPFFVQALAYETYEAHQPDKPVSREDVLKALPTTLKELDRSFFRVRLDRLTPREIEFVRKAAALGEGPYSWKRLTETMGGNPSQLSPIRAALIRKGMMYSPRAGELEFTVPLFAGFINRKFASDESPLSKIPG